MNRPLVTLFVLALGSSVAVSQQPAQAAPQPPAAQAGAPAATQPGASPAGGVPVAQTPPAPPPYSCEPVNPNATPEARALLKKLCAITGKGILTGQHNYPNQRSQDSDKVSQIVGKYPAIWGSDFGFTDAEDKDSIVHRDLMIEEAKKQAAAGSIITLCWHMMRPLEDEPGKPMVSWRGSVQARMTDAQWQELITSDSPLHQRWEKYIDTAAGFLKQLQDAHIPVLWRPMHENNGAFFWWGGRSGQAGTAQLYRELYYRLVNVHRLNNLLWVWNQNASGPFAEFHQFFPGQEFVDIVSYDNYRSLDDKYYWELLDLANGKPIALGEVGVPPSADVLARQPRWAWFMVWSGFLDRQVERLKAAYQNPYYINRGDPLPGELK